MQLKTLGRTGLQVSSIGLGLAALGRPGYINLGHAEDMHQKTDVMTMEARTHKVLDAAWSLGVRYFDAARSYGRAEAFLSSWLKTRQISREQVTVGSKWGYTYVADWQVQAEKHEIKEHSSSVLQRQFRESQELLAPYLGLYQIHSATLGSGVMENPEVLGELARLRDSGIHIGLSLSGAGQAETLRKALTIQTGGQPLFDSVQATWNLLETSAGPALATAHAAGMGVIVKEALANGRLTSRNIEPSFQEQKLELTRLAAERGTSIDALALAAVLAQPWVDVALSGAASVAHIESNVKALQVSWDSDAARRLAFLVEAPVEYWTKRGNLAWN